MADKPIGGLPSIAGLYDDSLLAVEQQGEARKMTGAQWKQYARDSVSDYSDAAGDSANAAARSADAAAKSASDAAGSAEKAQQYSGKPPVIRDGFWWTWDAEKQDYRPTGEAARGNLMYAAFYLDPIAGDLYMVADREYAGPEFRLNGADLEVVLSYGN